MKQINSFNILYSSTQKVQRFEQKQQVEVEKILNRAKWRRVSSNSTEMVFRNKIYPDAVLTVNIKNKTFSVFDEEIFVYTINEKDIKDLSIEIQRLINTKNK